MSEWDGSIPYDADEFRFVHMEKFKLWLEQQGAEIREPTNEWEVMRYVHAGYLGIIYRNKRNVLNYVGRSFEDIQEYLDAPDTARQPAGHSEEPQGGDESPSDHCERPPWE